MKAAQDAQDAQDAQCTATLVSNTCNIIEFLLILNIILWSEIDEAFFTNNVEKYLTYRSMLKYIILI